jgi:hypothetical protein
LITDKGKLHIKRFLARQVTDIARGVAVGVANDGATEAGTDRHLDFEFARSAISLVSADFVNDYIIFKATIPAEVSGEFNDIGLFTSEALSGIAPSIILSDFTDGWSEGTLVGTNSALGEQSLQLSVAASGTETTELPVELDLSDYYLDSEFKLALHVGSNVAGVEVGLHSAANASTYSFVPSAGYHIEPFTLEDLTGTADLAAIDTISVQLTATGGGTGTITLDGLRIDAYDPLDEDNLLVARVILDTPQEKQLGLPMDVQFSLEVNIT